MRSRSRPRPVATLLLSALLWSGLGLATPGVARADNLGAIGEGAAVLLALVLLAFAVMALTILTVVAALIGRRAARRSPWRRRLAMACVALPLLLVAAPAALIIGPLGATSSETLVVLGAAAALAAGPLLLGIRALRRQAEVPEGPPLP